jgi:hypothetical protein
VTPGRVEAAPSTDVARLAAIAGFVAVAGNLGAVLLLHDMPSAYRLARLDEWVAAVSSQPVAAVSSSVVFTLGLVAMAGWAHHLGRSLYTAAARAGASIVAVVSLANAIGTLSPIVQAVHVGACGTDCNAVGRALLGLSLTLDALFNLGLGIGLLLMATAVTRERWTRRWMVAAGLASLPVAGQALWDPAANMLYLAAPLWLLLIVKTSITWLRPDANTHA